jgi:hypothetical protein
MCFLASRNPKQRGSFRVSVCPSSCPLQATNASLHDIRATPHFFSRVPNRICIRHSTNHRRSAASRWGPPKRSQVNFKLPCSDSSFWNGGVTDQFSISLDEALGTFVHIHVLTRVTGATTQQVSTTTVPDRRPALHISLRMRPRHDRQAGANHRCPGRSSTDSVHHSQLENINLEPLYTSSLHQCFNATTVI